MKATQIICPKFINDKAKKVDSINAYDFVRMICVHPLELRKCALSSSFIHILKLKGQNDKT
jgi:hypothetical protein